MSRDQRASTVATVNEPDRRAVKLGKIEELVRAHERDGFGLLRHEDSDHTIAEHHRRMMLEALEADPNWEPPRRWYTDEFGRKYGLPID